MWSILTLITSHKGVFCSWPAKLSQSKHFANVSHHSTQDLSLKCLFICSFSDWQQQTNVDGGTLEKFLRDKREAVRKEMGGYHFNVGSHFYRGVIFIVYGCQSWRVILKEQRLLFDDILHLLSTLEPANIWLMFCWCIFIAQFIMWNISLENPLWKKK